MRLVALERELHDLPETMENDYTASTAEHDPESLVHLLVVIRNARAGLATLYDTVEKDLLALAGEKRFVVEGVGQVEIRKSTRRTNWKNDELYRWVVVRALNSRHVDLGTGELESREDAVTRVLSATMRPTWRVTALRDLDIDPDEWCDTDEGHYSVMLPGRKL